ncbi:MAG: hypothetical protein V2B19_31555 [Pseudomonadota bacterium]
MQAEKFSWQEGNGAFSIKVSIVKDTIRYIENQKKHHQNSSFKMVSPMMSTIWG